MVYLFPLSPLHIDSGQNDLLISHQMLPTFSFFGGEQGGNRAAGAGGAALSWLTFLIHR